MTGRLQAVVDMPRRLPQDTSMVFATHHFTITTTTANGGPWTDS